MRRGINLARSPGRSGSDESDAVYWCSGMLIGVGICALRCTAIRLGMMRLSLVDRAMEELTGGAPEVGHVQNFLFVWCIGRV